MIVNQEITAWKKLTGSDRRGAAQYTDMTLARQLRVNSGPLNTGQVRVVQFERLTADRAITYEPFNGDPDIAPGDKIEVGGAWYEVQKAVVSPGVPVERRLLYSRRIES